MIKIGRAVRRVVRGVTRGFDTITEDILDLDQSKQKEALDKMREEQERQQAEAEKRQQQEKEYQQQVAGEKDKINVGEGLTEDTTGVGLQDVKIDFGSKLKPQTEEDDLKKALKRKY